MADETAAAVATETPATVQADASLSEAKSAAERKEELRRRQAEAVRQKREAQGHTSQDKNSLPASKPEGAVPKVLRKEQIDNAVRFLSHPQVKSSPLGKKIAFLEHKGLNEDEISAALKAVNISAEDIKSAQDEANRQVDYADSPSASSDTVSRGSLPPLPPPPPPPSSNWKGQALTALLCFGFGTATSLLAAKYLPPLLRAIQEGQPHIATSSETEQKKKKKRKKQVKAKKKTQREITELRSNQAALSDEVREAVLSMKALMELQSKSPAATLPRAAVGPSQGVAKNEEIDMLKAELKALRARMLDQQTFGSNMAKSVSEGRAENPAVSISPTTTVADGSMLPAWLMNSAPPKKPSATPDSDEVDRSPPVPEAESTTTTTTTTTTSPKDIHEQPAKKERPPKPYQRRQEALPKTDPHAGTDKTEGGVQKPEPEESKASLVSLEEPGTVEHTVVEQTPTPVPSAD